jgi:hypothetical protein
MVTRRHVLQLAAAAMACALTGRALDASQAKVTTVTLTIEGMT